jgi:O-antigen/teichoic acid export membrane protein
MCAVRSQRLFSVSLRGLTLASKFLLIFFLARFLEPLELGVYGLLSATVGYSLYFLGVDFYTYTTRELLKSDRGQWACMLKSQCALYFVLYILVMPFLGAIFYYKFLPVNTIFWFFVLLVLEHVNQELGRLLVAISEQLYASVLLFLRSGLWALLITCLMFFNPEMRSVDTVFFAWSLGGLAASLLGVYKIKAMNLSGWMDRVDWPWVVRGLKIATSLLLATLAVRGILTLDRYWFQELVGTEVLGAYVLFMGISMALMSFLDAGVFAFLYPSLISSFQQGNARAFRLSMKALLLQTVGLSIAFVLVSLLTIGPILGWLDRPIYTVHRELFGWLLLATILFTSSMVAHYGLYAQGHDRPIIFSHVASLMLFALATWGFSQYWKQLAVPLGLCVSFFFMACWKFWEFYRLTPLAYRPFQSELVQRTTKEP